jgi:acyl-CoA reductase-like NAD-dependent aldehyde dehydrogenase
MTSIAGTEVRPYLLAGEAVAGGERMAVTFPYDGRVVAEVTLADGDAIERALAIATAAREPTAAIPPHERASVLNKAAALAEERQEGLARQMTLETGNAIWETRVEVRRTIEILRNAAEEARRVTGEVIPIDAWPSGTGRQALTRRFPVGPVLAITPYNAPLLLVAHKLASAYAAGNPCIVRPARKTPLSALSLGELMVEAGALPDAVTVVPCSSELGERMVRDGRIKMLSFTGSGEVGWHLRKVAATHRVALELGGNGAVIIHSDADLDHAAERCALGGFVRAGQACISVQRVFVAADVADAFEERFVARVSALKLGDPLDDDTTIGVLVDDETTEKALALIADAKDGGATVLCGGGRRGPFVEPTLLRGAPEHARVSQVEAFAPIVSLQSYTDFDEALAAADSTPYGLQAGLFTYDIRLIYRAFERLEVGALIVNDANTFRVDHMPYSGAKRSGAGREGVRYAIREMTEERLLVVDAR